MKKVFLVVFLKAVLVFAPCPENKTGCLVNHGSSIETQVDTAFVFNVSEIDSLKVKYEVISVDTLYGKGNCFEFRKPERK